MPDDPRYDDDFYGWTQHQARVLRDLRTADDRFDRGNVAEEIDDLEKSERDRVESLTVRVLEHLLKLAHSPADGRATAGCDRWPRRGAYCGGNSPPACAGMPTSYSLN